MAMKVGIRIKDVNNEDFERRLQDFLEIYAEETDSVIDFNTQEVPEGYEFDEKLWK